MRSLEPDSLSSLPNLKDACALKSCLLVISTSGEALLWAKKTKDRFKLDEDFFRTDIKTASSSDSFITYKLNIQSQIVSSISCGSAHALLLTTTGKLFSMGVGTHGRLGHGNISGCNEPKLILGLDKHKVYKIACGSAHNAALALPTAEESKGTDNLFELFTWGSGADNRLGHGNNKNVLVPTKVEYFEKTRVEDIACGFMHTAVLAKGKLYTFGYNDFGELGAGDKKSKDKIFCVNTKGLSEVKQIYCGGDHTICVCTDNSIYSWGDNGSGQLGHGVEEPLVDTPALMKFESHVASRITSADFFCGDQYTYMVLEISKEILNFEREIVEESERSNAQEPDKALFFVTPRGNNDSMKVPSSLNVSTISKGKEGGQEKTLNMSIAQSSQEEMENLMKFLALSGAAPASSTMAAELSRMSFRPKNLPKKTAEEEKRHRELVEENRREYLKKQKQKEHELRKKKQKEEEREKRLSELKVIWERDVLPQWNEVYHESRVIALWREGIPSAVRGKVWMLAIGNKSSITPELFKICTQKAKSIKAILTKISTLKAKVNSPNIPPAKEDIEELEKTKAELAKHEQPDSRERSISGIQYDLPRTFPELGFFKQGGGFYEELEQVLEAFVVSRPDIGYVSVRLSLGPRYVLYCWNVITRHGQIQSFCLFN